jgi:hypothetical protein
MAYYDLYNFVLDEISLRDDPAIGVGAVRIVSFDFTAPEAGGFPNDLGSLCPLRAHPRPCGGTGRGPHDCSPPLARGPRRNGHAKAEASDRASTYTEPRSVRALLAGDTATTKLERAEAPTPTPAATRTVEGGVYTNNAGRTVHTRRNIGRILNVSREATVGSFDPSSPRQLRYSFRRSATGGDV